LKVRDKNRGPGFLEADDHINTQACKTGAARPAEFE